MLICKKGDSHDIFEILSDIKVRRDSVVTASGDRQATFQLKNGVVLRGGYAGSGEPDPDVRDIDRYQSILSGDLNGDDGPDFSNYTENSYHVVTGSGTNATAVLDGLTLAAGNATGPWQDPTWAWWWFVQQQREPNNHQVRV